jgi:acetylornithine/N-succinyldiaminopimelate aminotransferase
MIGVEIATPDLAKTLLDEMLERRIVLNRTHETVLRFLPPFILTREHVDQTIANLDALLTQHVASAHSVQSL